MNTTVIVNEPCDGYCDGRAGKPGWRWAQFPDGRRLPCLRCEGCPRCNPKPAPTVQVNAVVTVSEGTKDE